jgi:lysine 2,3-aminomutase
VKSSSPQKFISSVRLRSRASGEEAKAMQALADYPTVITQYFADQIDWSEASDPLRRQVIPDTREKQSSGVADFCGEHNFYVNDFLIHRYPDRAVLLATNKCFGHCRFCFRKTRWLESERTLGDKELRDAVKYLKSNPRIKELIISGGDPLTLSNEHLNKIISAFDSSAQLRSIRIASRALTFYPKRVDAKLARLIKRSRKQVWFVSHFNHGREITKETSKAITILRQAGIPILNQTVLLKGINDKTQTLADLFGKLSRLGVKPYYLFQCDPVIGATHLTTALQRSFAIVDELGRNSGIIVPRFALEIPLAGKISPGPGWQTTRQGREYQMVSPLGNFYFYKV